MREVSLFIPCIVDIPLPHLGVATVSLLKHLDCRPFYHEEQTCCGQVLFNAGQVDAARQLARQGDARVSVIEQRDSENDE